MAVASAREQKPKVAIVVRTATAFGRDVVRGVMRYANARRQWLLLDDFMGLITDPADWPPCDGAVIAESDAGVLRQFQGHARHVVSCSGGADPEVAPVVCMDDHAIGRLAADHLADCRLEHFGFYCLKGQSYPLAERRLVAFRQRLGDRGMSCTAFQPADAVPTTAPYWSARPHWPALTDWLRALPKPVGVFATDDTEARELAAVCLDAGIAVPDRVAIVGVNNDELLCECAWPPLSSVQANFEGVGYAAARLLDRLLGGERLTKEERMTRLPPAGVARRTSTDVLAVDHPDLAEAVRFIRDRACDPCSVEDVAAHVAVARRWLERQFAEKLGRSPHDEIVRARMEAARRLLMDGELTLPEVGERCGFSTVQSFHRAFRQATGENPAAWRRSRRAQTR